MVINTYLIRIESDDTASITFSLDCIDTTTLETQLLWLRDNGIRAVLIQACTGVDTLQ